MVILFLSHICKGLLPMLQRIDRKPDWQAFLNIMQLINKLTKILLLLFYNQTTSIFLFLTIQFIHFMLQSFFSFSQIPQCSTSLYNLQQQNMSNLKSKIKVVFLGQQSTGKTSILTRFIEDKFEVGLGPTVGIDFMAKTVVVNGQVLRMQFWDTAGQERFRSLIPNYLKQAAIAFLVFDVTNDKSFVNLPEWIDLCNQNMGEKCVTLLLANKCDLQERQVSKEQIEAKAKQYGLKYFEVSAKTGQNIKQSLNAACQDLIQMNKKIAKEDADQSRSDPNKILNNKGNNITLNKQNLKKLGSVSNETKKNNGMCC